MKSPTLKKLRDVSELDAWRAKLQAAAGATGADAAPRQILICFGGSCLASGAKEVRDALAAVLKREGLAEQVALVGTGCMGPCVIGPVLMITEDRTFYQGVKPEDAEEIVTEHLKAGRRVERLLVSDPSGQTPAPCRESIEFFKRQTQIVLRNCGWVDPGRIEDTIARDGYAALAKILSGMKPDEVIAEMKASGLRGRGGAGFPTWLKWHLATQTPEGERYVLCNADEGDPGAYMDRSVLEGDPHSVIEGMAIAAYAIGARQGYVYVRAEYPLAVERLTAAIEQAHACGLLGEKILGSTFSFDLEIRMGSGAFVCGEETALIASIEGRRGEPRP
ncbi:MAG TPA: NAD(P)H-dependent oxidoreductase subunit E, partial [Kiritimatiellia bacterium]|nr:NAD(P)H-dependent oxidoreductase subunit E [Kiritimatiellia bacterium]